MIVALRIGAGVLLVAHGLVHLLYLAPDVEPFSIRSSRVLPAPARRPVALVLLGLIVVMSTLVALGVWGVPGLSDGARPLIVGAAIASAGLLVVFWNRQLAVGLAIDVALVVVAVWWPAWAHRLVPGSI